MKRQELAAAVRAALVQFRSAISDQIETQEIVGRYGGIENKFEAAFKAQVGAKGKKQPKCEEIGTKNYFPGRHDGSVDLVLSRKNRILTAFEFKAVRMPRKKANCFFDVGQLTADYLRMANATAPEHAWVIAFVYGPLVDDASSDGDLLRRFHNQMYVDTMSAIADGHFDDDRDTLRLDATLALRWREPMVKISMQGEAFAVRVESGGAKALGAICIEAK